MTNKFEQKKCEDQCAIGIRWGYQESSDTGDILWEREGFTRLSRNCIDEIRQSTQCNYCFVCGNKNPTFKELIEKNGYKYEQI